MICPFLVAHNAAGGCEDIDYILQFPDTVQLIGTWQ